MFEVIKRVFFWTTEMYAWAVQQLAELVSFLQPIEEIKRVADISLLKDEFKIRKTIEQVRCK